MKYAIVFILILVLILVLLSQTNVSPLSTYEIRRMKIGSKTYSLFVADTEEKKIKGLSGINKLPQKTGMIFIFDKPGKYAFWMKDMHFPLDFIFLREGKIVDLREDVSPTSYPEKILSDQEFDTVIELPTGEIKNAKIKAGESVNF